MRITFLLHESFEAPGAFLMRAQTHHHDIHMIQCHDWDPIPEKVDTDMLIIMGWPQSPTTTEQECPHFHASQEIAYIRQACDAGCYVVGACLGAQLIGNALGGMFDHSPHREIGVFDCTLTDQGKTHPFFWSWPLVFPVGHRHGDMPGLTANCQVLATSEWCPRQIIQYTPKVYGFQCHFEFTTETIEEMITHCGHELEQHKGQPYIRNTHQLQSYDYTPINNHLYRFLDFLITQ